MIELETNVFWDNTKLYQLQSTEARTYIENLVETGIETTVNTETLGNKSRDTVVSWNNDTIKYTVTTEYLYDISSNAFMSIKGLKKIVENYE